jgi:Zn finger protein HypA/HybF involved in hydrogenase expression
MVSVTNFPVINKSGVAVPAVPQSIRFLCSNGHKIRTNVRLKGHSVCCPACGVAVVAGEEPVIERAPITDTGAFRILTEGDLTTSCSTVPEVEVAQQQTPITDTGVFRILTESDLSSLCSTVVRQAEVPKAEFTAEKKCPRCSYPIQKQQAICPDCRLLLESSRSVFRRIYSAALKSLR